MSGQQTSVVYEFNIQSLTEFWRVQILKCYNKNLNSYNKGAVTMFLRGLRANPTHVVEKTIKYPTLPEDFSTTQILGGQVISRNQGLCSND